METKIKPSDIFSSLRAIAYLCNIVEGLDSLFFKIAKDFPSKMKLKTVSHEEIIKNFENPEYVTPDEYVKVLFKIIKETEKTKLFLEEDNISLESENVAEVAMKMKIITIEEYERLLSNQGSREVNENNGLADLVKDVTKKRQNNLFYSNEGFFCEI